MPSGRASRAVFSTAALLCAVLLGPAPAAADPPPPKKATAADRDHARALAEHAFERLEAKEYDAAIDLFTRAESHFHAPTHLFYIAQAREKKGQLLEAADTYRKVVAETLARDAPQPFRDAQADARRALDDVVRRTPELRVEVAGKGAERAVVDVGGRAWTIGEAVALNPGTYVVRVTPESGSPLERSVVLSDGGGEVAVRVDLGQPMSLGWPLGVLGLGVAAGGAALGMGVTSRDWSVAAEEACRFVVVCPAAELRRAEDARTLRDAAIVTGIVGGTLVAAGFTLLLVRPTAPKTTVDPAGAEAPTVALRAGPTFVGVVGTF